MKAKHSCPKEQLLILMEELLCYQQANHHLARMVHRETTMDSTLVREIMSTYLQKEKHEFERLLKRGIKEGVFQKQPLDFALVQIRSMIVMPYLYPQYLCEIHQLMPTEAISFVII